MNRLALLFSLTLGTFSAQAETIDPLWLKTIAHMQELKKWVAQDMDIVAEVSKGSDPSKTVTSKSHLNGWKDKQAVYDTIQLAPPADPNKPKSNKEPAAVTMMNAIDKIQASIFDPENFPKRLDNQKLDGQSWTLFQLEQEQLGQKMAVKVWIDSATGSIHRMESQFHVSMYGDGIIHTLFENDERVRCFPKQINTKMDILIPFKNGKMNLQQNPKNWILRPV